MINTIFFSLLAIFSLFVFMNLGKIKASKKQTDRDNRINRFGSRRGPGNQRKTNSTIVEGEAEVINDKDEK
ncbi:MAG: hypothetical protein O3B36_01210 [Proteobacteria bacterium]|jgi:hypothetical protein|nr:hypothetical protein [Pseudomonadota bacterium]MDA1341434.1 hypothetical protein [Pseudomonadota bacterium]